MEARPDLVHSFPKGDSGGSPSRQNDEDPDESRKDGGEGSENPSAETQLPPLGKCSESNNIDNQPLESLENCHFVHEVTFHVFPTRFARQEHNMSLPETAVHFMWQCCFLFSLVHRICSLYIILKHSLEFRQVV